MASAADEVMGVPCIDSDGFCHAQRTIRTPLHPPKLRFPFVSTMRPTLLIRARFQLAVPVLLAIVPIISATSSPRGTSPTTPTIIQHLDKWNFMGCFDDDNVARTLATKIADGLITVEYCLEACKNRMSAYAGMEFGKECWCGDAIQYARNRVLPSIESVVCNYACHGSGAQICGGENHLVLYSYSGVYPSGI